MKIPIVEAWLWYPFHYESISLLSSPHKYLTTQARITGVRTKMKSWSLATPKSSNLHKYLDIRARMAGVRTKMNISWSLVRPKSSTLNKFPDTRARITGVRTKMNIHWSLVRPKSSNLHKYLDTRARITGVRTKMNISWSLTTSNLDIAPEVLRGCFWKVDVIESRLVFKKTTSPHVDFNKSLVEMWHILSRTASEHLRCNI